MGEEPFSPFRAPARKLIAMTSPLDLPLAALARALRARELSAAELTEEAIGLHEARGEHLQAYKHFDADAARVGAARADRMLSAPGEAPPMCGMPVSVKDLYGVAGMPTFAGTARRLPSAWEREGWLVRHLREQGAVVVGKTHTVELAYGAVGINPHWGTPYNPWDPGVPRVPGGSSCGAGVSLWEGSAVVALGSDTGGSIRIPASLTGTVGHKTTHGRWPVDGVVPLSFTLDSVGGLTRTVADSAYFFGALDPDWGDPAALGVELEHLAREGLRVGMPGGGIWGECQNDVAHVLHGALDELDSASWRRKEIDGSLLDSDAVRLYMRGGIAGTECKAFLQRELPEWLGLLHPTVASRLDPWPASLEDAAYREALAERNRLVASAGTLFEDVDVLALPAAMITPPPVGELDDLGAYASANATLLRPTCPVSVLGLCSVAIPVGLDDAGMPVGLQLVARGARDELALAAALAAERVLGPAADRLGPPPGRDA